MFSFREFIKRGFLAAVGKLADYKIILNAAGYLEKGVLTEDDLAEIQSAIDAHNAAVPFGGASPDTDADAPPVPIDNAT